MKKLFQGVGLCILFVLSFIIVTEYLTDGMKFGWESLRSHAPVDRAVTLLAFGDINLGRTVGQKILSDEIDFPFQKISFRPDSVDIVFANLESQLSEQRGETQDPVHNMIFTGPPAGARSLAGFGISYVSTANNHAFDYGKAALLQTLDHLDEENIGHIGTTRSPKTLYEPLLFEKKGIRFALFAVTDLMNFKNGWHDNVAVTDTGKLFPALREAASSLDVVILSFHGGEEYGEKPTSRVKQFAEECVQQGVKIFIGHHPHVPYGIERVGNSYIFHSLGNFVFYQPQLFWTQLSFGAEIKIVRTDSAVIVSSVACLPLQAGYQPSVLRDSSSLVLLHDRLKSLSNIPITLTKRGYFN